MGLGIGTRTCTDFLNETVDVRDDGELTDVALFKRLEYMQWANGFRALDEGCCDKVHTLRDAKFH